MIILKTVPHYKVPGLQVTQTGQIPVPHRSLSEVFQIFVGGVTLTPFVTF